MPAVRSAQGNASRGRTARIADPPSADRKETRVNGHQMTFILFDLFLIVVVARVLGAVAARLHQPPVIGEILAGVVLGPTLLGDAVSGALFPPDVRPYLTALANLGVALFVFLMGLEFDVSSLAGHRRTAAAVAVTSVVLPFVLGIALATHLSAVDPRPHRLGFVLFLGAAMSVTAFPVLARILADSGLTTTTLGGLALTCAALDDVLAWSLLSVVAVVSGARTSQPWLLLLFPLYLAAMSALVRPALRRAFPPGTRLGPAQLATVLAGVLMSGAITDWIGLHFVVGAFLFGIVMPRAGRETLQAMIAERIGELNATLLLPAFFIVTGLAVRLSGIGRSGLVTLALVLLVAITGKFGGAFAAARLCRLPARESAALATLMNTRGLTELIILTVGVQLGVLDRKLFSIMVVMALLTTAMAGPLLRLIHVPTGAARVPRPAPPLAAAGTGR